MKQFDNAGDCKKNLEAKFKHEYKKLFPHSKRCLTKHLNFETLWYEAMADKALEIEQNRLSVPLLQSTTVLLTQRMDHNNSSNNSNSNNSSRNNSNSNNSSRNNSNSNNSNSNNSNVKVERHTFNDIAELFGDFNVENDRDDVKLVLFDIYKIASKQDRKLVDVLINLLNSLPTESLLNHKVEEAEFINGYLQPFLSPLFHKPQNSKLFLWLNTKTDLKNYSKRPDGACVLQLMFPAHRRDFRSHLRKQIDSLIE
ncbi:uncharacterized protein EV154DRAFT_568758 [Mucor mucedo]|uniref:uncharacterized protein n=1 Tax=Mucor mucedo TaxID=29922 RepID=UPI00221EC8C9|nr:uncharacterized protein EV154DRAFT_568758 [Mucor mucedo]KAI7879221.1 hypothetical protein EV154DRAFT_568758 [Mucor mucedo]